MRSQATKQRSHNHPFACLVLALSIGILAILVSSNANSESSIDPISQVYFVVDSDQAGPLKLKRIYSSASTFRGHFGTGWCSELDARILIYNKSELRFRGCDLSSGQSLDARRAALEIQSDKFGFRRKREDGAIQLFSRSGYLIRLIRADGTIQTLRDDHDRLRELLIQSRARPSETVRRSLGIAMSSMSVDVDLALISSLGTDAIFQYRDAMLVQTRGSRFTYNDDLNLTFRVTPGVTETIEYDSSVDRVTRIARSSAFGQDRLLLAIVRTGKSNEEAIELKAEMTIESQRGAEMRPVRIFYNRDSRRLSLEGDRNVARMILSLLRA